MGEDLFEHLEQSEPVTDGTEDTVETTVDSHQRDELLNGNARNVPSHVGEADRVSAGATEREEAAPVAQDSSLPGVIPDGEPVPAVEPVVHGTGFHLLFTGEDHDPDARDVSSLDDSEVLRQHSESALAPYYALVSQFEPTLPEEVEAFPAAGHMWELTPSDEEGGARYWSGGIAARGESFETYNEYQLGVRTLDDLGERKLSFQFRPALPVACTAEGDHIGSMPRDMPYGIRVQVNGSNVAPEDAIEVLQRLAEQLDISPGYFDSERVHPWSRGFNAEVYVRVDREQAQQAFVERGGLLERLTKLASSTAGSAGELNWDNQEVIGHRNAVLLDETAAKKLVPDPTGARRLKYYHPKRPRSERVDAEDDPLVDPKVEVQYSNEASNTDSVPWSEAEEFDYFDLLKELESFLVNALSWAGLSTRGDPRTYTEDSYFSVEESVREHVTIYESPVERVTEAEEAAALRNFAHGGASTNQREVLVALADGGDEQHWRDLGEEAGVSQSTVYRAAQNFSDVIRYENGLFSFRDGVVRERIGELLGAFNDAMEWVRGVAGERAGSVERVVEATSALGRWARRHLATVHEGDSGLVVDLTGQPMDRVQLFQVLRAGYDAAAEEGINAVRSYLDETTFRWTNAEGCDIEGENIVREVNGMVKIVGRKPRSLGGGVGPTR
jgi:hypothetical protein